MSFLKKLFEMRGLKICQSSKFSGSQRAVINFWDWKSGNLLDRCKARRSLFGHHRRAPCERISSNIWSSYCQYRRMPLIRKFSESTWKKMEKLQRLFVFELQFVWWRHNDAAISLQWSVHNDDITHNDDIIDDMNDFNGHNETRLGICRDCRDRRSCKSFVSCVNFSRKQRSFLHILQVYTHLNVNFLHNC